jgi:hypothetical protein
VGVRRGILPPSVASKEDSFNDKYNINPKAGKTRLGAKHSEATKELMSKLIKENPYFLALFLVLFYK